MLQINFFSKICKIFLTATIYFSLSQSSLLLGQEGIFNDRLVVQVEDISYSQWDVETHYFATLAYSDQKVELNVAKEWEEIFERFKKDMAILKTAQKRGSYVPTEVEIINEMSKLMTRISKSKSLKNYQSKLNLNEKIIRRHLVNILIINYLKKDRLQKQLGGIKNKKQNQLSWIDDINKTVKIREYQGAKVYFKIY